MVGPLCGFRRGEDAGGDHGLETAVRTTQHSTLIFIQLCRRGKHCARRRRSNVVACQSVIQNDKLRTFG